MNRTEDWAPKTNYLVTRLFQEHAEQRAEIAALKAALRELHAVVKGECPALLNEDSGGDSELDIEIEDLLKKEHP